MQPRPYEENAPAYPPQKPEKVRAISWMILCGGISSLISSLSIPVVFFCVGLVWPGVYYGLFAGIMAIIRGNQLMSDRDREDGPPKTAAILLIATIINGDLIACTLGIVSLVFLGDPEVEGYYYSGGTRLEEE